MVLETLAETLCKFLDTHYFVGTPTADEMTAHVKAEEEFMEGHDDGDDIILTTGKGEGEAFDYDAFYDYPRKPSAGDMLHAYDFLIRESTVEPAEPVAEPVPPAAAITPAPMAAPPAPAAKKAKRAKKAKGPKRGTVNPKPKAARLTKARPSAHAARTPVRV